MAKQERVFRESWQQRVKGKMYRPINPDRIDLDMMKWGQHDTRRNTTGCVGERLGMTIMTPANQKMAVKGLPGRRREFKKYGKNHKPSKAELARDARWGGNQITLAYREGVLYEKLGIITYQQLVVLEEMCQQFMGGETQFREYKRFCYRRAGSMAGRGIGSLDGDKLRKYKAMINSLTGGKTYSARPAEQPKEIKAEPSTSYYVP